MSDKYIAEMNISSEGLNLIKNFEGFRPLAYYCPAGYLTIGYGHAILPGEKLGSQVLNINSKISLQEALYLLNQDIDYIETTVRRRVRVPLTQGQFDALVSLIFNWGSGKFARSEGLQKLNKGDYEGAWDEFEEVINVNGKPSNGLIRRRLAEAKLWDNAEIKQIA